MTDNRLQARPVLSPNENARPTGMNTIAVPCEVSVQMPLDFGLANGG